MNANLNGLIVRPGDSLIIALNHRVTDAEYDEICAGFREALPGIDRIVLIEDATAIAAYRPAAAGAS